MSAAGQSPLTVSVRQLCDFAARAGDLDLRFNPSATAAEGVEIHQWLAARRQAEYGDQYQPELSLTGQHQGLLVRGRADGWLPGLNQLEEVKSFRGRLDKMPDNQRQLHWAQARVYGALACQAFGLSSIRLALVYVDAVERNEQLLVEHWSATDLQALFDDYCARYLHWARQLQQHRQHLLAALQPLQFPYPEFHAGQRQLAESVYKAVRTGQSLLVEAPTGIGKTLATLFPALKAFDDLDKLFFLTAKTPGRQLAFDALEKLRLPQLSRLELIAKIKACVHPDAACHGDDCPLARGFYDRLPAARAAAFATPDLQGDRLQQIAAAHQVCPYFLGQEMVRWVDLVVADYNYYFDSSALLYALTEQQDWRVALLVDECHNLPDRARAMYSASLSRADSGLAKKTLPKALQPSLKAIDRQWQALVRNQSLGGREKIAALPEKFLQALQQFVSELGRWQASQSRPVRDDLLDYFFAVSKLLRIAEGAADDYVMDVDKPARGQASVNLRNVLPGPWLAPRFARAHTAVLFSATLQPLDYAARLLALPADHVRQSLDSPFDPDQLQVRIARHISTRYQHRQHSLAPLVALIGDHCRQQPGNYLAFFSSFDYLNQAEQALRAGYPDLSLRSQQRHMDEAARQQFVAGFEAGGRCLSLAVLGGAFAEGIDLPGDRLLGAFVATLGLPQFNDINEDFRRLIDARFGMGYEYIYLYPGLQKVVQAAGRVIRSRTDQGFVFLLDDRFAEPRVRALLPPWWRVALT